MFEKRLWILIMLSVVVLTAARPQEFDEDDHDSSHDGDKKGDDVSRVQIKVYRGPTKHDGYAPWGFWVKQPSDE